MTNTIGFMSLAAIVFVAGSALHDYTPAQLDQEMSREHAFVAAARRGDENAVRKALDDDSTLAFVTDIRALTRKYFYQ